MSSVKIVWATPEIDKVLGHITRVSNPANQANQTLLHLQKSNNQYPLSNLFQTEHLQATLYL